MLKYANAYLQANSLVSIQGTNTVEFKFMCSFNISKLSHDALYIYI